MSAAVDAMPVIQVRQLLQGDHRLVGSHSGRRPHHQGAAQDRGDGESAPALDIVQDRFQLDGIRRIENVTARAALEEAGRMVHPRVRGRSSHPGPQQKPQRRLVRALDRRAQLGRFGGHLPGPLRVLLRVPRRAEYAVAIPRDAPGAIELHPDRRQRVGGIHRLEPAENPLGAEFLEEGLGDVSRRVVGEREQHLIVVSQNRVAHAVG